MINHNYNIRKDTNWQFRLRNLLVPSAVIGLIAFGAAYLIGNKNPYNHKLSGVVTSEKEVYGNILTGYATERKGVIGFVERKVNDLIRPGPPMKLYTLVPEKLEYDTVKWFKKMHHTEQVANLSEAELEVLLGDESGIAGLGGIHLQSEGDIADPGYRFSAPTSEIGRFSKTFLARGLKYVYEDPNGTERVVDLRLVLKSPDFINFYKSEIEKK